MIRQNEFIKSVKKNDLVSFKSLLNDITIDPSVNNNYALRIAAEDGNAEMVELLINDPRVDILEGIEFSINLIFCHNQQHILVQQLLWNNEKVKDTLKESSPSLYNKFVKFDLKNKIKSF
jgi:hypothetical protein